MHDQGNAQGQKRAEKTLGLYLRLIFGTEADYNNKTKTKKFKLWVRRIQFADLLHYQIQMSSFQQKQLEAHKQTSIAHSKGQKLNKQKLSIKKTCRNSARLKMLKELQENMEDVKKMMYQQNGNTNKDKT